MAARFWVGGTGTWDGAATTHWAATTGGASGASAPTSADNVTFDASSGLVANSTITVNSGAACNNFAIIMPAVQSIFFNFSFNFVASGSCSITGNSAGNRILFQSTAVNTQRTITLTTLTTLQDIDFMDIKGAGDLAVFTGTRIGDALGNATINFTVAAGTSNGGNGVMRYWVGTTGGNWSTAANWSTSSGGASGASVPLAQDDVVIDANSIGSSGRTITANVARLCRNMDASGVTNSPTWAWSGQVTIYGSFTAGAFAAVTGVAVESIRARSAVTFTSAGNTWVNAWQFVCPGGTVTFQDNLTVTCPASSAYSIAFLGGNFNCGSNVFTTVSFNASFGALSGTIDYGSSLWVISGANGAVATVIFVMGTGPNIIPGTSALWFIDTSATQKTIQCQGRTFNNIVLQGGAGTFFFNQAQKVNVFQAGGPAVIKFAHGTTTTMNDFAVNGSAGNLVTITSDLGGSPATLSKAGGGVICDYLSLQDIAATGGAGWYAGTHSTNVSGNSGWIFTAFPFPANTPPLNTSFTATPIYNKPALRYPQSGSIGEIEIPIHITKLTSQSEGSKVTEVAGGAMLDLASNLASGGMAVSYGANELPKIVLEGFIDTPFSTSIFNGQLYPAGSVFPGVPTYPSQPLFGTSVANAYSVDGNPLTYGEVVAAYFEGRTSLANTYFDVPWQGISPRWFRDSYGRVYTNPRVIALTLQRIEAVPNRVQFTMTLQV